MDGVMVLFLKKIYLERQDGEKLVHISFNVFYTVFFPRPNLRRDVIIHGDACLRLQKLGDIEVKTRVIHKYNHIRRPLHNVFFAESHVAEDGAQMKQHGDKAHVCQFFKMLYARSTNGSHEIAAKETELGCRVYRL